MKLTRRHMMGGAMAGSFFALPSRAATPRELEWDDLIPPGVPYGEIIGEGEMDILNDTWNPIYDENAFKLNEALNGALIRLPGFVVPLEMDEAGVTEFILVPYVGACIHTPPPPANQLVFVTTETPWLTDDPWAAVWVIGTMKTQLQETEIAETGYAITADAMEIYQW